MPLLIRPEIKNGGWSSIFINYVGHTGKIIEQFIKVQHIFMFYMKWIPPSYQPKCWTHVVQGIIFLWVLMVYMSKGTYPWISTWTNCCRHKTHPIGFSMLKNAEVACNIEEAWVSECLLDCWWTINGVTSWNYSSFQVICTSVVSPVPPMCCQKPNNRFWRGTEIFEVDRNLIN